MLAPMLQMFQEFQLIILQEIKIKQKPLITQALPDPLNPLIQRALTEKALQMLIHLAIKIALKVLVAEIKIQTQALTLTSKTTAQTQIQLVSVPDRAQQTVVLRG